MENREQEAAYWEWANKKLYKETHEEFVPIPLYQEIEIPSERLPYENEESDLVVEIIEIQL